jgi:hypothetical protein
MAKKDKKTAVPQQTGTSYFMEILPIPFILLTPKEGYELQSGLHEFE